MRLLARLTIMLVMFGALALWGYATEPGRVLAGLVGGCVALAAVCIWRLTGPFNDS